MATGGKLELPVLLAIVSRSQSVISLVRKPLYESHTAYWFIGVFNVIIALFSFHNGVTELLLFFA